MNLKSWTKTILTVYRHLPKITKSIDKIFEARAIGGSVMSSNAMAYNDVYNLTNNLINLTERKKSLINLKLLADKVLTSIDRDLAKLLILRYIDGYGYDKLAEHFGVCERTIYRKMNRALDVSVYALLRNGYDENKIENMIEKENWLFEVCRETAKEDFITLDTTYLSKVYDNYKKFSLAN